MAFSEWPCACVLVTDSRSWIHADRVQSQSRVLSLLPTSLTPSVLATPEVKAKVTPCSHLPWAGLWPSSPSCGLGLCPGSVCPTLRQQLCLAVPPCSGHSQGDQLTRSSLNHMEQV